MNKLSTEREGGVKNLKKMGDIINGWPPNKFLSIEFNTFTIVLSDIILSAKNPKLKVP